MEKSGQTQASKCKDGVDMISNLHDHVLQLILSRIPTTEELIRTSILSKRWKYLWTSVPSIDIDYSRRLDPFDAFQLNKFEEFVYKVLTQKSSDLGTFRISCANYCNMSTIAMWIELAVRRNVKQLNLTFCPRNELEFIYFPRCLVTCGSLEELRLFSFGHRVLFLPMLNPGRLLALRVFELNDVTLSNDGFVTKFLELCPLLEDVKLRNLCFSPSGNLYEREQDVHSNILISCPKLVVLELTGSIHLSYVTLQGLNSLKKAVIDLEEPLSGFVETTTREFFAGISNVESLSINLFFARKCIDAASLPQLKILELKTKIDDFPMDDIIKILEYYPHLEALHLIIKDVLPYQRRNCWEFPHLRLREVETRRILTRSLKRVEFLEFNREGPSLSMSRTLLLYGNALEEMVFSWDDEDKYPRKSTETLKEVSTFYKASSVVKLITLLKA